MPRDNGVKLKTYRSILKRREKSLKRELRKPKNVARWEVIRDDLLKLGTIDDHYQVLKFRIENREEQEISSDAIDEEMTDFFKTADEIYVTLQSVTVTKSELNPSPEVPIANNGAASTLEGADSSSNSVTDSKNLKRLPVDKVKEEKFVKNLSLLMKKERELLEEQENPRDDFRKIQIRYDLGRIKMILERYELAKRLLDRGSETPQQRSKCEQLIDEFNVHCDESLKVLEFNAKGQEGDPEVDRKLEQRKFDIESILKGRNKQTKEEDAENPPRMNKIFPSYYPSEVSTEMPATQVGAIPDRNKGAGSQPQPGSSVSSGDLN